MHLQVINRRETDIPSGFFVFETALCVCVLSLPLCCCEREREKQKSRSCLVRRLGDACHRVHKLSLTMIRMIIVWSASGKSTLLLLLRTLSVSTVSLFLSECSARGSLSFKRKGEPRRPPRDRGAHVSSWLRDEECASFLSLSRSPQITKSPPPLLERADDAGSPASSDMETESATSERSSRDDKAFGELLDVVTILWIKRTPGTPS